jgi:endonuclease/exonuclease/phosphatase family metal-dependent hydrolase
MQIPVSNRFWPLMAAIFLLAAPSLPAQSIKVLTYNLRLDLTSDGDDDWAHRREFLLSQLQFYAPDIFGTQEGLPHQIQFLQKSLPNYGSESVGREGQGKGESTAIFYNKAKFALQQTHTFWLSPTPDTVSMGWDAACLRVCTAVLLKNKAAKRQFWVFNTHLDHIGETARQNSIDLILRKIRDFNPQHLPVIFMGDLNSTPDMPVIAKVKKELTDSREISEATPFGPSGTFNGFKFNESVTKLIDYVFVSKTPGLRVLKYAVLSDSKNLHYPSDHLPVLVEMVLGK